MLANPDYSNISIDDYKWEILQTFKLSFCVYITCPLNLVYHELIANIQYYLFTSKTQVY